MFGKSKSFLPVETMRVSDGAAERLSVIEQVQGRRDWIASVIAETPDELDQLHGLKHSLEKRGTYSTYLDKDSYGQDVLRVHHVGRDTNINDGFDKLGVIGGLRHMAEAGGDVFSTALGTGKDVVKYTAEDPARLLAGLYAVGDGLYASAGKGGTTWEDKLISFAGYMGLLQSLIFVAYAKDGSEYYLHDIDEQIKDATTITADKVPLSTERGLESKKVADSHWGPLPFVTDPLKKHPIDLGSAAHITGQLGMILSGGIRMHKTDGEKGAKDIGRAALSILSWVMLNVQEEHTEDKTEWTKNPAKRVMEEFREVPHHWAGATTILASVAGLVSSQENANFRQMLAESAYMVGDVSMFFARKADYGDAATQDTTAAAKAAATFIQKTPLLFSDREQTTFVRQVSDYLAARLVGDNAMFENLGADDPLISLKEEQAAELSQQLAMNIFKELAGKEQKIDKVANHLARIADKFPDSQRDHATAHLVDTVAALPGVFIDRDELIAEVKSEHARFANVNESPMSPPSMSVVASDLAELTFQLPSVNAGYNASRLFDTISDLTRNSPAQERIFEQALYQKALDDTGITPAMAQSMAGLSSSVSRV